MNCKTCQLQLEDWLYGELDAATTAALNEHLSVCGVCRQEQAMLEREKEIFTAYYEQNVLEPSDEMWAAIHARIKEAAGNDVGQAANLQSGWRAKLQGFFAPLLAPALLRQVGIATLLILVSVGLTTLYFITPERQVVVTTPSPTPLATPSATPVRPEPEQQPTPAPKLKEEVKPQLALGQARPKPQVTPKPSEEELLSNQIAKAMREYQNAITLLERTIAKRKSELDEGTIKQFEGSLALIDASIAASREALRAHPNDPTAARFLLAAYSKKVELMQEIAMR
jgi:hypothetical protein